MSFINEEMNTTICIRLLFMHAGIVYVEQTEKFECGSGNGRRGKQ